MTSEVFVSPTYKPSFTFAFEERYEAEAFRQWMEEHWTQSLVFSGVYLAFLYLGTRYMRHRPAFDLRLPLALWSGSLALLSWVGALRILPEMYFTLTVHGFERSVCDSSFFHGHSGIWCCLFVLSKAYELGDTVFIVLRKSPLILLHWYHHVTVLVYVWYGYPHHTSMGRWSMNMNYSVHAVMYTYYTLKALKVRVPRWINPIITSGQIAQMVMGLLVLYTSYTVKQRGEPCQQTYTNIVWATCMYLSYLILFLHFFTKAYVFRQKVSSKVPNDGLSRSEYTNGHTIFLTNNNTKKLD